MRLHRKLLPLLIGLVAFSMAQEVRLAGPVSGLLYNRATGAVQPILGIPGGAHLGPPILAQVEWAVVAPDGQHALVRRAGQCYLVRQLPLAPEWIALEAVRSPELAAWNRESSAAAAYSPDGLYLIRNSGSVEPLPVPERILALAVDAAGRNVLAAGESGVYLARHGLTPWLLAPVRGARAIAVHGDTAFVAAANQVLEIRNFADPGQVEITAFPAEYDPASDFAGIACSPDGRSLLLADRGAKNVAIYDLASRNLSARVALDFVPTGIDPVPASPLYLLRPGGGLEPFYVLDAQTPSVYFVPAGAAAPTEE